MGKLIQFPIHRTRRFQSCEECGHPRSVRSVPSDVACRFCGRAQIASHCESCSFAHFECPACSRVMAGADEIF